jgi:2-polyprenyl-3-methyl-5-hydroxy-6-metoxy-1,4-benzoquinol methylase
MVEGPSKHSASEKFMLATLKQYAQGLTYILSHPYLLRRIIMRELFHSKRYSNKRSWTAWQIYDAYTSMPHHGSIESYARPLNIARINTISNMVSELGDDLKILDVGCGDGSIGKSLRKMGHNVISVELPKVAVLAKKGFGVTSIVTGDAETLPFCNEAFDVVVAAELLEHLWNPNVFMREAHRVLRPCGHLIISGLEGPEALRYDTHKQYFDVNTLKNVLEGFFTLQRVKRLGPLEAPTYTVVVSFRKL